MKLSKYLVLIITVFCAITPFYFIKASTTTVTNLPCSNITGSGTTYCDVHITMNNDIPYSAGDFMDVKFYQDYVGIAGQADVVTFNSYAGIYNNCPSPNSCLRAKTYVSSLFSAPSFDDCYNMSVYYKWIDNSGTYQYTTQIPYQVGAGGPNCPGGSGGGGGGGGLPPTISVGANPSQIYINQTSTITWNAANADECTLIDSFDNTLLSNEVSGLVEVAFGNAGQQGTHVYNINCVNYLALGPDGEKHYAEIDTYLGKIGKIVSHLIKKASADIVTELWSYGFTTINFAPSEIDLTDLNNAQGPYIIPVNNYKQLKVYATSGTFNSCTLTGQLGGLPSPYTIQGNPLLFPFTFETTTFNTPGTYPFFVNCTWGGSGTDNNNEDVIVTGTDPFPDLTVGPASPIAATIYVPVNFTATVSNIGNASTEIPFFNFFQVANGPGGSGAIQDLPYTSMPALGAGASNQMTQTHTFTSVGTKSVRGCADKKNRNDNGVVNNESNEYNNCGGWVDVEVSSPDPLPNLTANPSTPTSATVNSPVNLSAVIKNIGTVSTGASFYNFIQISLQNPGSGSQTFLQKLKLFNPFFPVSKALAAQGGGQQGNIINLPPVLMSALEAGGSAPTSSAYTFTAAGSYWVRACADKSNPASSGVILESSENDNCGAWTFLSVNNGNQPLPDLTAGSIILSTALVNTSAVLSASIINQGNASTEIGFNNFVQVATNPLQVAAIIDLTPPIPMNALPAGASEIAQTSYKFTQTGTYYARMCADKSNRSDPGKITESNENNNCGPWTTIIVGDESNLCEDKKALNYGLPLPCLYEDDLCLDPTALNYGKPLPCEYELCEDKKALNYGLPLPCLYEDDLCLDPAALNYGKSLPCVYPDNCLDPNACNYGLSLPCIYDNCSKLCLDPAAINYGEPLPCEFYNGCDNGAVNPPLCTIGGDGKCLNGAKNPPICKKRIPKYFER